MLIIFSGRIYLLKLPACVLERQIHRSICHFGRIGGGESKSKNAQQDGWKNVGVGGAKVLLICLRCTV